MTTAGIVLLVLAALAGTAAWPRRLPLSLRAGLVTGAVLLLGVAFVLAAADTDVALVERLAVRLPLTVPQALGWLLIAWLAAAGGGPFAELVLRTASGRSLLSQFRNGATGGASSTGGAGPTGGAGSTGRTGLISRAGLPGRAVRPKPRAPQEAPAASSGPEVVIGPHDPPRAREVIRPAGLSRARESALVEEVARAHQVSRTLETSTDDAAQVLRGGSVIGVLERLAVAGALLSGAAQGVALVVAIKALGRYPELRAAGASERFIIGTLASLLWAAAATGTGLLLLG